MLCVLRPAAALAIASVLALTGCTDNRPAPVASGSGSAAAFNGVITVTATDTACTVSRADAPSGNLTFSVTNNGTKVNEFYLLREDGLAIAGEVENIGPGIKRDLVLRVAPGSYFTACKPGMVGDGIRSAFAVSDSGSSAAPVDNQQLLKEATDQYALYVRDQTEQLLAGTEKFVAAFIAGRDDEAKSLYSATRLHWERIEPVAESFGDLDPAMDAREADVAEGEEWTGWHVAEKDLWAPASGYTKLTADQRRVIGEKLLADTKTLYERTRTVTFTIDQLANGAKGLLDEVASSKVTGEEEAYSRTDLVDFQGNIEGARVAWTGVRPILKAKDPALDAQLEAKFAALQTVLDQHKSGNGFVTYDKLTEAQVKELADAVDALAEPLSKLTASVVF